MFTTFKRWLRAWAAPAVFSLLAACGGGNSGNQAVAPSITTPPSAVTATEGETATFTVAADGSAPLAYQWRRNGTDIAGATAASYTTPAVAVGDDGALYSVVVSNSAGSVTSSTALLTALMTGPPTIVAQPASISVTAPASASFSIQATGPGLAFQWLRNGVEIAGASGATYSLTATAPGDNGAQFTARVGNSAGTVLSQAATLTVVSAALALSGHFAAEVGETADAGASFFQHARSQRTGRLVVFDAGDPARQVVVEAAGGWLPQATLHQAHFDAATGTFSGLHERWRVVLRGGRIMKLDLAASAALPTLEPLSSLRLTELCRDYFRKFEDWQDPNRAVLVYSVPPAGGDCLGNLDYRAVRVSMSGTAAAIPIARPVDVIRDALGSITGFVLHDGSSLVQVDADFGNPRILYTNGDANLRLAGVGVWGAPGSRYVLFQLVGFSTASTHAIRTAPGATPVTLVASSQQLTDTVVADGSGLYFITNTSGNQRLWHVADDLAPRAVAERLPPFNTALYLTPTRVIMHLGNTLLSVLKSGGPVDSIGTVVGSDHLTPVVAVNEDIYFKRDASAFANGVELVRSDGTQRRVLPGLRIQGSLLAAVQPVAALSRGHFVDLSFQLHARTQFGADQASAVVMTDHGAGGYSLSGVTLLRFDADRSRTDYGALPNLLQALAGAVAAGSPYDGNAAGDLGIETFARGAAVFQLGMAGTFALRGNDAFLFGNGVSGVVRVTNFGL